MHSLSNVNSTDRLGIHWSLQLSSLLGDYWLGLASGHKALLLLWKEEESRQFFAFRFPVETGWDRKGSSPWGNHFSGFFLAFAHLSAVFVFPFML